MRTAFVLLVLAGASAAVPRAAVVIDGRGKFLIPGLWDMHVHLGFARESAFPALVANGVTAVRDLGGDLSEIERWRTEIAAGSRIGPLIVRAGPMLVGQDPLRFQILIPTPEAGRAEVRRLHAAGVEQIKVKSMPRDAYVAIVAEARAIGLPVTGHLPLTVTPEEASDAGQSFEHVTTLFDGTFMVVRRGKDVRPEVALLDANPLADIRNARRIRAVILAGKFLDRAALDRLLAQALELAAKN